MSRRGFEKDAFANAVGVPAGLGSAGSTVGVGPGAAELHAVASTRTTASVNEAERPSPEARCAQRCFADERSTDCGEAELRARARGSAPSRRSTRILEVWRAGSQAVCHICFSRRTRSRYFCTAASHLRWCRLTSKGHPRETADLPASCVVGVRALRDGSER